MKILTLLLSTLLIFNGEAMAQRPEDFPLVTGQYQMTKTWVIDLGDKEYRRRIEDGQMVIWRPGITMWINVYGYPKDESAESFIKGIRSRSDLPADAKIVTAPNENHFAYFFKEVEGDQTRYSLQTYTFGPDGHVLMAVYFDREHDLDWAKKLMNGLKFTGPITNDRSGPKTAK